MLKRVKYGSGYRAPCCSKGQSEGTPSAVAAGDRGATVDGLEGVESMVTDSARRTPIKGVAKLGFSWEAMDVRKFEGEEELAEQLQELAQQNMNLGEAVMVQEWVDFDCELRLFFAEPRLEWGHDGALVPCEPIHILYTRFCRFSLSSFFFRVHIL